MFSTWHILLANLLVMCPCSVIVFSDVDSVILVFMHIALIADTIKCKTMLWLIQQI